MFKGIDFYSDTLTKPSAGMRKAMCEAEVGDEQKGEDPTTRKLEELLAETLGMSSALFFPSATMANQIAIRLLTNPGDEIIASEIAHIFTSEGGGPAVHSGVMTRSIRGQTGLFSGEDVKKAFRSDSSPHDSRSRLLSIENTSNMGGGLAWPLALLDEVVATAKSLKISLHLDGSRLFNAAIALAIPPKRISSPFDTATVCLSKGLGCPVGAVLGFDKSRWTQVRRLKQLMGGAMRQSGMLAAAGLYALQNNVDRLVEDHAKAKRLAEVLSGIKSLEVEKHEGATNMVFFRWNSPQVPVESFLAKCEASGVRFSHIEENRVRAVTHLDIRPEDIETTYRIIKEI